METIVYASYGTAMGHDPETLARVARAPGERVPRPPLSTIARHAIGGALVRLGRRLEGSGTGALAGGAPAPAAC
jgi:hypothetical protein